MTNLQNSDLEIILDSVYNGIIAINKEGEINLFNKSASEILGMSKEEVLGCDIREIIPETGLFKVLESSQTFTTEKFVVNKKTLLTNRSPIFKEGELIGALGIFQDISELEHISQELAKTKAINDELRAIIESSYDGFWITDGEGYTIMINSSYERISGAKAEEVVGRHMKELEEEGFCSESVTLKVLEQKERVTLMHELFSGKKVMVTGNPVFDSDGNITKVVTNVRDISELLELKDELEKTQALTRHYKEKLTEMEEKLGEGEIVAKSKVKKRLLAQAARVAAFDSTVLITGETGVGKEIVAKYIHQNSNRSEQPFIKINCGAIPENLLESELFGHEPGSFTGASKNGKPGKFEIANGGTLLLDEIGELSKDLQVKLLRALQDQEITRIGGVKPRQLDVKIIACTNRDLEEMVSQGEFREDLYYRLSVVPLYIPPLRERPDDIPFLIRHYIRKYNEKYGVNKGLSSSALEELVSYNWPGNVRELENMIERLVIMVPENLIETSDLPQQIKESNVKILENLSLPDAVSKLEKRMLQKAMEQSNNTREAAQILGVAQSTVVRKLDKYGLNYKHDDQAN
ncbi:sigma-54-dependent Fis family transcriptional regulator [Natranaerobius thermophilus]|uniref:HTH-type transcriptional regulatory protein TyrR n=1 Tax=Natranaerobius thermophilus (strain ATCC BAA-1301 / DSM 18059 / JW/NM-WN-LF) TaxID=457570 RepID=B2A661_NATTJ|nr:sigma-54-dependent Fis family transcriptional regulator [Natranaerobius thermophilus]ACB85482.1 PAS modulated sigma54 specific transcriptional regulator, Fis family [Natranaerobius thermophilus JW/NM-WN-LF]